METPHAPHTAYSRNIMMHKRSRMPNIPGHLCCRLPSARSCAVRRKSARSCRVPWRRARLKRFAPADLSDPLGYNDYRQAAGISPPVPVRATYPMPDPVPTQPARLRPLTRDEVRDIDRRAIETLGLPGIVLMENAGRGAAELLIELGIGGAGRRG